MATRPAAIFYFFILKENLLKENKDENKKKRPHPAHIRHMRMWEFLSRYDLKKRKYWSQFALPPMGEKGFPGPPVSLGILS